MSDYIRSERIWSGTIVEFNKLSQGEQPTSFSHRLKPLRSLYDIFLAPPGDIKKQMESELAGTIVRKRKEEKASFPVRKFRFIFEDRQACAEPMASMAIF